MSHSVATTLKWVLYPLQLNTLTPLSQGEFVTVTFCHKLVNSKMLTSSVMTHHQTDFMSEAFL